MSNGATPKHVDHLIYMAKQRLNDVGDRLDEIKDKFDPENLEMLWWVYNPLWHVDEKLGQLTDRLDAVIADIDEGKEEENGGVEVGSNANAGA